MTIQGSEIPSSDEKFQFSILHIFGATTFAALLIGVLAVAYQSQRMKRDLRAELVALQMQNDELQAQALTAQSEGTRTVYAEKILFHVVSHPDLYPELQGALQDYQQHPLGISMHGLENDDNLTYLNIYTLDSRNAPKPLCTSFLVSEEPFKVLDVIVGEQSRYPRKEAGVWYCGAGVDGKDRWYQIQEKQFVVHQSE